MAFLRRRRSLECAANAGIARKCRAWFVEKRNRRLVLSSIVFGLVIFSTGSIHAQSSGEEYQVKGAFLFHFAQLVDWPQKSFENGDQSLFLCIFEDEAHREELENTVEGKAVGTRVLHVKHIQKAQDIQGCHILFLGKDESKHSSTLLAGLRNVPVLTVGETDNFSHAGGMIRFHLKENKIRFDINLDTADSAGLKISSRLLLLATHVTRGNEETGQRK